MTQVLYRKYRPKTFSELTGQDTTKTILQNEVATDQIAHAYLFSGSRGVGKTSVARILAKAINCLERKSGEFEPCNNCTSCLTINEGKCFDILEIDAASHTGVDNVRENIIEGSRFPPSQTKYKVFIIDEAQMLSRGAFNALLKTLEDAPAQVVFILATTELHKVPETVASRCQQFIFKRISADALIEKLNQLAAKEGIGLTSEVAQAIADNAAGSLRDALGLLGQLISLADENSQITMTAAELVLPKSNKNALAKFYELLREKNTNELLILITGLVEEGTDVEKFYDDCVIFGRELILENPAGNKELVIFLENLLKKKSLAKFSPLPQLPLELAVVNFCCNQGVFTQIITQKNAEILKTRQTSVEATLAQQNPLTIKNQNQISPEISITLDQVKERWSEFLEKISVENHSLPMILRLAEPRELTGDILKIAVQYRFHRERLNESKTRAIVEKFLREIFNQPLRIEAQVSEQALQNQPSILHTVLQEFGGRVVE